MTIRKAGMAALVLMAAVAITGPTMRVAAQGSAATTTTPPTPSLTGLQKALNLTDAQVTQLQTLIQSQGPGIQTLLTNLRTAQQALQTALKGTDTAAIGTANLAVQAAETALSNAQKANLLALMAVLTASQQQIINDYLLIAQNGGPGPFGLGGPFGPGGRGGPRGPGGANGVPQFRGGPRP